MNTKHLSSSFCSSAYAAVVGKIDGFAFFATAAVKALNDLPTRLVNAAFTIIK